MPRPDDVLAAGVLGSSGVKISTILPSPASTVKALFEATTLLFGVVPGTLPGMGDGDLPNWTSLDKEGRPVGVLGKGDLVGDPSALTSIISSPSSSAFFSVA